MTGLKSMIRLAVIGIAGCLCSCIDCREEYWLHANGGGRVDLTYEIPSPAAAVHGGASGIRNMVADFLSKAPELDVTKCEVTDQKDHLRVRITANFESAMAMKEMLSGKAITALPSAASSLAGEIRADFRGRTLDFERRISPSKALPGSVFLPSSQFDGHRLLYIMHLPAAATESNATRVENGGRSLVWDIPLARAVEAPVVTRFKMAVPIPWHMFPAIGVPLSLFAFGWMFLRHRKSRTCFPAGNPENPVL